MTRTQVRLELLKLCHHHGRSPVEIVAAAKALEEYILEETPSELVRETESVEIEKKSIGRPRKKTDNADILS